MSGEPKQHRWFRPRYSLTTLFVVVTVVGCWLGYSLKWIRDRREFLNSRGTAVAMIDFAVPPPAVRTAYQRSTSLAPFTIRLFGEAVVEAILIGNESDRAEAGRLFPEANIIIVDSSIYP